MTYNFRDCWGHGTFSSIPCPWLSTVVVSALGVWNTLLDKAGVTIALLQLMKMQNSIGTLKYMPYSCPRPLPFPLPVLFSNHQLLDHLL